MLVRVLYRTRDGVTHWFYVHECAENGNTDGNDKAEADSDGDENEEDDGTDDESQQLDGAEGDTARSDATGDDGKDEEKTADDAVATLVHGADYEGASTCPHVVCWVVAMDAIVAP